METIGLDCLRLIFLFSDYNDLIKWRLVSKKVKEIIENLEHPNINFYIACIQCHQIVIDKLTKHNIDKIENIKKLYLDVLKRDNIKMGKLLLDNFKSELLSLDKKSTDEIISREFKSNPNLEKIKLLSFDEDVININNDNYEETILKCVIKNVRRDIIACLIKIYNCDYLLFKSPVYLWKNVLIYLIKNKYNVNIHYNGQKLIDYYLQQYMNIEPNMDKTDLYNYSNSSKNKKMLDVIKILARKTKKCDLVNAFKKITRLKFNVAEYKSFIVNNKGTGTVNLKYNYKKEQYNKLFEIINKRVNNFLPFRIIYVLYITNEYLKYTNNNYKFGFYYLEDLVEFIINTFIDVIRGRKFYIGNKVIIGIKNPECIGYIDFIEH